MVALARLQSADTRADAPGSRLYRAARQGMVLKPAIKYKRVAQTMGVPRDNHL